MRFRSIAFAEAPLPRKAAFAKKVFHPDRDALNAYIVYEQESSLEAALAMNGVLYQGKHLRVDKSEKEAVCSCSNKSRLQSMIPSDLFLLEISVLMLRKRVYGTFLKMWATWVSFF